MNLKTILRSSILLATCFALSSPHEARAQNEKMQWARQMGGTGWDAGTAIATDLYGNVYTTGAFEGTSDFDPGAGTTSLTAKQRDIYVSKMNADGVHSWAKHFGNTGTDQGMAIKTDPWGYVYVAGQFAGNTDFGAFTLAGRGTDVFVIKMDTAGTVIWAKNMGGTSTDIAYGMDVDRYGNVYIGGEFNGAAADFDPGPGVENLVSKGGADVFVCKLDSAGNFKWAKGMGGTGSDYAYGISVDSMGAVYTSGSMDKNFNINPDPNNPNIITSIGSRDVYVSKLDSNGNYVWGVSYPSTTANTFSWSHGIRTDRFGNVFVIGYFRGTVDFDPATNAQSLITSSLNHYFVSKLTHEGKLIWTRTAQGNFNPRGIDVDHKGAPYITGWYNSNANLNPGGGAADTFNVTSKGSNDLFILSLDSAGTFMWGKSIGGIGAEYGYAICVDKNRSVYGIGYFGNDMNVDTSLPDANFKYYGSQDIYVLKINQPCLDTSTRVMDIELCEDNYEYNEVIHEESGTYTYNFVSAEGCDSTIILNLVIKGALETPIINVDEFTLGTATEFATYQWYFNDNIMTGETSRYITVAENGDYKVAVSNGKGCSDTSDNYKVTNVTGISENSGKAPMITVYPNPVKNIVYINTTEKVNLSLYSIDGKLVEKITDAKEVDMKGLADGLYFFQFYNKDNQLIQTEKLVKQGQY